MLRTLQMRVNRRTDRYSKLIQGEQADQDEMLDALRCLAEQQERIYRVTRDLEAGQESIEQGESRGGERSPISDAARAGLGCDHRGPRGAVRLGCSHTQREGRRPLRPRPRRPPRRRAGSSRRPRRCRPEPPHGWPTRAPERPSGPRPAPLEPCPPAGHRHGIAPAAGGHVRPGRLAGGAAGRDVLAAARAVVLPNQAWLADSKTPVFEAANLRLLYGRWLVQGRWFEEALEQLGGLKTGGRRRPRRDAVLPGGDLPSHARQGGGAQGHQQLLDGARPARGATSPSPT